MMKKYILLGLLIVVLVLPGCSRIKNLTKSLTRSRTQVVSCSSPRVNQAFRLYGTAKTRLAQHFDDRDANHLIEAYYAASDSISVARSVAQCPDRQKSHFAALKNLEELNRSLQKVVRLNMRDEETSNLIAIYRDQYYKVMPNDIR